MLNSMFDELANCFKEITNLKSLNEGKRLKSVQKATTYLEPQQASTIKLFYEYTYRLIIFAINAPS